MSVYIFLTILQCFFKICPEIGDKYIFKLIV